MRTDLITVERYNFKPDWTISRLFLGDVQTGFIVEDEIRDKKIRGETAIPYGRYLLGCRFSPKFSKEFYWSDRTKRLITAREFSSGLFNNQGYVPHELLWLLNIPNFEYVLIHWGNTDDDTDGCLIVGNSLGIIKGQEAVLNSRITYQKIYPLLYPLVKAGKQYLSITKKD